MRTKTEIKNRIEKLNNHIGVLLDKSQETNDRNDLLNITKNMLDVKIKKDQLLWVLNE